MASPNITQIPAPRVEFIDPRTGLMAREWYRFFLNLYTLTGSGSNAVSLDDLQVGPVSDNGANFVLLDNLQVGPVSDSSQFSEQLDALDQKFSLEPSFSSLNSGAFFSIVGPPTAGSVPYGDGNSLVFSPTYISVTPGVGNVAIAAPASGVGLTVNGVLGAYTQYIENPGQVGVRLNTAGTTGIYTAYAQSGAIGAYIGIGSSVITGAASTDLGITSNGGNIYFGRSAGAATAMQIANAGNVTINAPTSGYSLTVSGTANATFTDGTGNYGIQMAAGAAYVGTTSNHSTTLRTNNTDRVAINNVGNVTVNAPSSGNALTVVGLTGAATYASTNTTSGSGSEYHYQATNGTDSSFNILLSQVGATVKYAHLFTSTNTPLYLGTNSTIRATVAADGSVVIGAPTGGSMGSGTINATNLYVNGVAVSTGGGGGGSGTVTSVNVSGGTTGLTFSGGPITVSGTITMAGTLAIANGGTNGSVTPTAGAIAYGTGTAYGFTAAGTTGQVLTSAAAGTPTWISQSALSVGSATTATNIASGAANQIHYQTGAGATSFITAPTVASTALQWNGSAFVWAAASGFTGGTLTSQLILAAGTASANTAPVEFQSGTVNTTAEAGALEYDGKVFYATAEAAQRGTIIAEQFQKLTTNYTTPIGTANTLKQAFNATTNGALTVAGNTTYMFECMLNISAMSGTAGTLAFGFGGTATYSRVLYVAIANKTALAVQTASSHTMGTAATATVITASNTTTTGYAYVTGTLVIGTGGTIIPSIALSIAAACVVNAGSYFRLTAISNNTATSVGNWS